MENLIFIHGWIDKYIVEKEKDIFDFYKPLIDELNRKFNVYFVTLPGFSQNLEPLKSFKLNDYVEYLKNFIEGKGISNFYLMGHSFGGQVCAKFSYYYPEKIKKLILYNPACIRKKTFKHSFLEKISFICKKILKPFPFLQKIFYKIFVGSTCHLKLSDVMKETKKNIINEDLSQILKYIKNETIIIYGAKDKIIPLWQVELIHKLIPNSKLIINIRGDHSFHKYDSQFILENL